MKTDAYPISEHIADAVAEANRLKEIGKQFESLNKQKAALLEEEAALAAEVEELTGYPVEISEAQSTGRKNRGGRVAGSKNKKTTKSSGKASTASKGKSKGGSKTGESREEIMLRVMPTKEDGPIKKDAILALVEKAGFKSNAADPLAGIGQALNNMRQAGHATNKAGSRGEWCLTASGVKARDAALEAESKEAEAK